MPQYNGVWTVEQQAQALTNQQWVTDPNFKNTTLLLQADNFGTSTQNNTFLDSSTNNFTITRAGNTTQGSFSPFSQAPGYWSNYFNGSTDYLTLSSGVTFGTSDYTLEFWAYKTSSWTDGFDFLDAATSGLALYVSSGTMAVTKQNTGGAAVVLGSLTSLSPNIWYHFAIVRSGGSVRCYVNGAPLQASVSDANNYSVATTKICGTGDGYYDGYISNMRLATSALYSISGSSIVVPNSPLTTASGVQYIGSQSNRFVDTTGTQTVAVGGGTPSVQAFGPFAPALQWTPDVIGGSAYFDGTTDYLTFASSAANNLTGDFTIECWAYPLALGAQKGLIAINNNGSFGISILFESANTLSYWVNGSSGQVSTSATYVANTWYHIALVRSGSTNTLYVNGVSSASNSATPTYQTSTAIGIGRVYNDNTGFTFNGYISGVRIIKGSAVVPSGVPTAPPTAVANTHVLANFTNAGIYDGKMANNLETVGNAQVSTSTVKYGSGSMYFDGTGDWLVMRSTPGDYLQLGGTSRPFTIEAWTYPTSFATNVTIAERGGGSAGWNSTTGIQYTWFYKNSDSKMYWQFYAGGTSLTSMSSSVTISLNTWTHVAVSYDGITTYLFVNGVQVGTNTAAYTIPSTPNQMRVGAETDGSNPFFGYIDDLRVTQGVCRYITNFTPPRVALPRQ